MDFYHWFLALHTDCARRGIANRLREDTIAIWRNVWRAGIQPTVAAVCLWAKMDPNRFEQLRQTELEVFNDQQMAA